MYNKVVFLNLISHLTIKQVMLLLKTFGLNFHFHRVNKVIVIVLIGILQERVHLPAIMIVAILTTPQLMKMKVMSMKVQINLYEQCMSYTELIVMLGVWEGLIQASSMPLSILACNGN